MTLRLRTHRYSFNEPHHKQIVSFSKSVKQLEHYAHLQGFMLMIVQNH